MSTIRWIFRKWALFGLLGFAIIYYQYIKEDKLMHQRAKFTLGTIDGYRYTTNSGRFFGFNFTVAGKPYGGSSGWESGMREADGSPCLVEYDSIDPQQNAGHFAIPIPDSIRRPPRNGWRVPPFPVPARYLDHGRDAK